MGKKMDRHTQHLSQAPGHPQSHQKGGHVGIFPGPGFGADADGRNPAAVQFQGFQQIRQIPGMLVDHFRLGQAPATRFHRQKLPLVSHQVPLPVHERRRSGVAAGIQPQDRFLSGHASSPGSPKGR